MTIYLAFHTMEHYEEVKMKGPWLKATCEFISQIILCQRNKLKNIQHMVHLYKVKSKQKSTIFLKGYKHANYKEKQVDGKYKNSW